MKLIPDHKPGESDPARRLSRSEMIAVAAVLSLPAAGLLMRASGWPQKGSIVETCDVLTSRDPATHGIVQQAMGGAGAQKIKDFGQCLCDPPQYALDHASDPVTTPLITRVLGIPTVSQRSAPKP